MLLKLRSFRPKLKNWYLPAESDKISPKSFTDNNKLKVNKTDIVQSDNLGYILKSNNNRLTFAH